MSKYANIKNRKSENLSEILAFLHSLHPEGLAPGVIAQETGLSSHSLSAAFIKDNMHLSRAEYIAKCYGYKLFLVFPKRKLVNGMAPPPRKREFPNAGNLSGLVDYILDSNYSVAYVAGRVGCGRGLLERAFASGDIMISSLKQITEGLGIEVQWVWEKQDEL